MKPTFPLWKPVIAANHARRIARAAIVLLVVALAGCKNPEDPTFTVSVTVSGLTGTLVLVNTINTSETDTLTVTTNGSHTFTRRLANTDAYTVAVSTVTSGVSCTMANGSGIISGTNVTNVTATCSGDPTTITYSLRGTITGLSGSVELINTVNSDGVTRSANGNFNFSNEIVTGALYNVTVLTQPADQTCTVSNGSGTATADVTNIAVSCLDIVPPVPAQPAISYGTKRFQLTWSTTARADYYRLYENPDGSSGYARLGGDLTTIAYDHVLDVPLWQRIDASYAVQACNTGGCSANSAAVFVSSTLTEAVGYIKASNPNAQDQFGFALALAGDGETLVVGAAGEDSTATGIGGNQANNGALESGAVYVIIHRTENTWTRQAFIKASNTAAGDGFGTAVAISEDGNTLAVGAPFEDSGTTSQANNGSPDAGAVYVYTRTGTVWSLQAYVKASDPGMDDHFGNSVALSADGDTLVVGAPLEDGAGTGTTGDPTDNSATDAGAVYVYTRSNGVWTQQSYIKAANTETGDEFGHAVALSSDGATLAVGAILEDSAATDINGDASDNTATSAGAVYVYAGSGSAWAQQAYLKASNAEANDGFGYALSFSAEGDTLVVGAPFEDGAIATSASGAVYAFARASAVWSQQAYISDSGILDLFGTAVSLSADGDTLAVGAIGEQSVDTGVGGDENNDGAGSAGAAFVFTRTGAAWAQQAFIKASNTEVGDLFGSALGLSSDASTLVVGAPLEDGASTSVLGGDATDNTVDAAGAAYLY